MAALESRAGLGMLNAVMLDVRKLLLLLLVLPGCVGTALPQPPNHEPIPPELVSASFPEAVPGALDLTGAPGAAPAGTFVSALDLDALEPVLLAEVNANGGFHIAVPADRGHVIRLQVRSPEGRSDPTDLHSESGLAVERPRCMSVPLEVDLGVERSVAIPIDNDCGASVTVAAMSLRAGEPAIDLSAPSSIELPDGARATFVVRALGNGAAEDVVFVPVTVAGVEARFPITVHAAAR